MKAGATEAALAHLHRARTDSRQEKRKSVGLTLYVLALLGAWWVIPALARFAGAGAGAGAGSGSGTGFETGTAARRGALAEHVSAALPALAPPLLLAVLLLTARGAMWRGPVLFDLPTTTWLLPTPVDRTGLLRSRLRASALLSGTAGLLLGGLTGFLLQGPGTAAPWPLLTAAGAWAGGATALAGCAVGVLVERRTAWVARHAVTVLALGWTLTAAGLAAAVAATVRGADAGTGTTGQLLLWSGPWGWAVQPLVAALGGPATGWAAATALTVLALVPVVLLALRDLPRIPLAALRHRAVVASRVGTSLFVLDLRQARAGVPALRERGSRPAVRLPVPRSPRLLVPWRDATSLLRHPGRLVRAAVWAVTAVVLTAAAPSRGTSAQQLTALAALVAAYLAAAQLTEPARLESDDIRRSANLPWTARATATRHAVVPGTLLLTVLALGAAVCVLTGHRTPGLAALVGSVPAMTAAALVSSYRGIMPVHVLIGTHTPMGSTGPWQAALWYARGPLAALLLTAPVLITAIGRGAYGPVHLLCQLLTAAAGLWWTRRTAHRLHTG
ncbi:DUF6297 family protein [Streptomyces sp. NPDC004111]|uniref:DUF6297 family protein n=1 Tax=Streptomyces sp. NPDC004111 TaxID=3364690 RepID=UPI0036A3CB77